MVGVVVLLLLSVLRLDGNRAKHCAIFSKMPKANHIKIVIFRKHCRCSLINTDGLIYSL